MEPLDATLTAPLPVDWLAAMANAEDAAAARRDKASISTVARRGTLNLVGAAVSGVLNFALVVIVTRTLHKAGAGLFFEATSVFLLAGAVAKFGSDTALVRFISQDRAKGLTDHIRRHIIAGIGPSAFLALIAGALLFWFAPQLAGVFELTPALKHSPELVRMIRVLAVFIPVYVTYWNGLAVTVGFGSMLPSVVVDSFMTSALQPVIVLIAAELALGSQTVAAGYAAPMAFGLIPIYLWVRRLAKKAGVRQGPGSKGPGSSRQTVSGTPAKDFWLFAIPRGVASIFQVGQDRIGILLVGALDSAAGAGVFAATARWLIAGSVFSDALNLAIMPTMSEHLARRDYAGAGRLYQVTTGWVVLISGPMYLTMAIFPEILLRPFGHGFDSGALALTVLATGTFAASATGSNGIILLMGGKSSWNLFDTSLAVAADVVIGIVLIPHFGLLGAAAGTVAALMINNVIPVLQIYRFYRMHPFGQGFWVGMAASLCCFGLVGVPIRLFLGQSFPVVLVYALVSCTAYAVMLWLNRHALQLTSLSDLVSGRIRRPGSYAPRHGGKPANGGKPATGGKPARPATGQRSARLPDGRRSARLPDGGKPARPASGRKSAKDLRM
jgi:O-antigen/teichoic acid export membrane protein